MKSISRRISSGGRIALSKEPRPYRVTSDPAAPLLPIVWQQAHPLLWSLPLLPCKYFHDASQLRFRHLSAVLFDIISLPLVIGKVPKQFKNNNCFNVTAQVTSRSSSYWWSYQGPAFPDSFSFLRCALNWFGSKFRVHDIWSLIKSARWRSCFSCGNVSLLTSNQSCSSPGHGPLIFPKVSLCSDQPSACRSFNAAESESDIWFPFFILH